MKTLTNVKSQTKPIEIDDYTLVFLKRDDEKCNIHWFQNMYGL